MCVTSDSGVFKYFWLGSSGIGIGVACGIGVILVFLAWFLWNLNWLCSLCHWCDSSFSGSVLMEFDFFAVASVIGVILVAVARY
jgi:hypothetical protein